MAAKRHNRQTRANKQKPTVEILFRRNAVLEALRGSRREIDTLWVQGDLPRRELQELIKVAKGRNVLVKETTKQKLGNMANDSSHQGVALTVSPYEYSEVDDMLDLARTRKEQPLLLILDQVQGPTNVGALLRSAESCGAHGVIMQERHAPDITPHVVAAAVGATEHLNIARVTNLVNTLEQLKSADIWVAALDLSEESQPYDQVDLNRSFAIVVGNEGSGIRRLVRENCDLLLRLPMRGQVESLNAAISGSLMLYAAWQARGFDGAR